MVYNETSVKKLDFIKNKLKLNLLDIFYCILQTPGGVTL